LLFVEAIQGDKMGKRINSRFILIVIMLLIFIISFNCIDNKNVIKAIIKRESISSTRKITVVAVGDIMFHIPQIQSAEVDKTYNFKPVFEAIKPEIIKADIAIGNFEAVILPEKKPSGFPRFNVPIETLDAIKYAGFDVLSIANNHIMDYDQKGLYSTKNLIEKKGFISIGAGSKKESKYAVINSNGIKVGILTYTFGTNNKRADEDTLNYINIKNIEKDIKLLKGLSDFIIVYLHDGTEYVRNIEDKQRELFRSIADLGADCILNSHPHVFRDSEIYYTHGRKVFINYSLGNFLSNQNDLYTDIGLMVKLNITKTDNVTELNSNEIIPVYRLRYTKGSKSYYNIILCSNIANYSDKINMYSFPYGKYLSNKFGFPKLVELFGGY
jgi:poly-gamma-glutamate capsule biosynthesis protein CapA/YwtB (metallophosphatase superfamily)